MENFAQNINGTPVYDNFELDGEVTVSADDANEAKSKKLDPGSVFCLEIIFSCINYFS